MNFNQNRLRFVHCEHLFSNFQEITEYVRSVQYDRASLYAEPMIFKYGEEKNPNIVLAIGSVGEGEFIYDTETGEVLNETFYIDFSQAERDIKNIYELVGENKKEIERIDGIVKNMITACGFNEEGKYVPELDDLILGDATSLFVADKMLSEYIIALERRQELYVEDTPSINLTVEKDSEGTTLSADVKLGTKIYEGQVIENIIVEQEDGIFTSVDLDYSEEESKLTLTINGEQKKDIKLPVESHLIKGEYDPYTEELILTLNNAVEIDGKLKNEVRINIARLIDEWDVLGEASETPIVLTREHLKSEDTEHEGIYDWQDILKADVRILDKEKMPDNILSKDSTGKFLYVEGAASNISYVRNNEKITVQQGIDEKLSKTDISQRKESTINLVNDGLYSFVDMTYDTKMNKLIFQRSNPKGEIIKSEYVLNSVQLIQKAYFDVTTEEIVIQYLDAIGELKEIRIPLQIIVNELDVDNTNKTVTLTIVRNPQGQDKISAEVNIAEIEDNIIENVSHSLYVRGTADNIKMIDTTLGVTVEAAILALDNKVDYLVDKEIKDRENAINDVLNQLNAEVDRAKAAERLLQDNIDAESRRAIAAEEQLSRDIIAEIERAERTENSLQEQITAEVERAKAAEETLTINLEAEIERSTEEDASLNAKILEEIERAKVAEHDLKVDLINEYERATLKEAELERLINREIERSTEKDALLTERLDGEIERAISVEDSLRDNLNSEIERAKGVEQNLIDAIKEEYNRATAQEHLLEDAINVETTRAKDVEEDLLNLINAEVERAIVSESNLDVAIKEESERAKTEENRLDEKINSEIERSLNKDKEITDNLEQAKLDLSYVVKNSGTISLTKTIEEVGSSIVGKVNVSSEAGNLINTNGEPLYAAVDLLYDSKNNVLTLTRSGAVDKTIQLNEGSLLQSIVYDDVTKELIITYFDSYGNERQERVNVRDLFNQWVVETNHLGAVQLSKQLNYDGNGTDKLIAEVVISELNSNLLVNDSGSLYVSNSAKDILMGDSTSVLENIINLKKKDKELEDSINEESNRAQSAESTLQKNIDDAVKDSIQRDTDLTNALNSEIDRAERVEGEISSKLDSEIERSVAKDEELTISLNAEIERSKVAEQALTDAIQEEKVRAEQAEHLLEDAILSEENRAKKAEGVLTKDLADEIDRAKHVEGVLSDKISAEIERSVAKDSELEVSLNAEIERAKVAEQILTDAIEVEVNERKNADYVLENLIADEKARAEYAEDVLRKDLALEIERSKEMDDFLSNSINEEALRASEEEKKLHTRIDDEILRATAAENANYVAIQEEKIRAEQAEHNLEDLINKEKVRAEKAESTLQKNIDDAVKDSIQRDTDLTNALNSEIDRSKRVENEISSKLDSEIERSVAKDSELEVSLNAEIERAKVAEQDLSNAIKEDKVRAEKADYVLENLIADEKARAEKAESTLQKNIDLERSRAEGKEDELRKDLALETERSKRVENEISSKLLSEIERSVTKDSELEKSIKEEIERAKVAEQDLSNAIKEEKVRAEQAEHNLEDAILSEENRAKKAEGVLQKNIEDAVKDSIQRDTDLTNALNSEIDRAKHVEGVLSDKINSEIERSVAKDSELEKAIKEEIERAKVAEQDLSNAIKDETLRAEKADYVLENLIADEKARAEYAEDVLRKDLVLEIERSKEMDDFLSNSINEESLRASEEEKKLNTRIDNEISRATAAENANYVAIQEEKYRAEVAEHNLEDLINREKVRAEKAESTLQKNIDLEQSRAEGREIELETKINNNALNLANEIERALSAESELRDDIDAETTRAIAADDSLRGLISTETERAAKEEARLESLINTEIGRAQTAEAELAKDIESVKNTATNNSEKIDNTIIQVEEIVKTYAMSVKDTASIKLTKEVIDAGGFIVSADVKLSTNDGNQLITYNDGLYTNVLLTYSENNNTLHFTANGITQDIPLTSVSTIEEITYDPNTSEIVIKYISNGELNQTRFPASSMFKPITTNNDDTNVVLKQFTNTEGATELSANLRFVDNVNNDNTPITLYATEDNKLKAKLNIADSAAANNILEITSDGSGVWVNGIATNIEMVNKQLGLGSDEYPFFEAETVEKAIHYLDGRVDELRDDFEAYVQEDLVNSMLVDINNLKSKTDINAITTPGIELTFESTESESSLKANVIISDDPHNLLKVYSDTWNEFVEGSAHPTDGTGNFIDDTYNGVLFDGNIDYLTFSHKDVLSGTTDHFTDWTRHLQIKRDDVIFESKEEALEHLNNQDFLADKKDGEPLLARYKFVDEFGNVETSFILGFVREDGGQKSIQTLNNKGSLINRLEYVPNATQIVTKDAFGNEIITNVTPESLYLEYTDSSSLKHTIVTPLKELVEEYVYPQAKATTEGKVVTEAELGYVVDGVDNAKEHLDENGQPIYLETTVRQFHNVNFDIERNEDDKSIIKADVDYYDCGEYDGEDYIKPESYVIAYFKAENTSQYRLVGGDAANHIKQVYVDGVEKGQVSSIAFDTLGEHKVKIVFDDELTNMTNMFAHVEMSTISLQDLITKNVTSMNSMFRNCDKLVAINVGIMDTTNVTDMSYMLADCDNLEIINLNGLNTKNVTSMKSMLSGLPKITKFDLTTFNLLNVINFDNMFDGDIALTEVKMMSDINSALSAVNMFININTTGVFYYNINYNYSRIISSLPSTWTAIIA